MRRREFIASIIAGAAAPGQWLAALSRRSAFRGRILMASGENTPQYQSYVAAFQEPELGWAEGRSTQIDYRWAAFDRN
jgi:hypothetical protein